MPSVTLFFRRPRPSYFSIEGLFEAVVTALPEDIRAEKWTCPHLSEGLAKRVRNVLAARRVQSQVNHITGDVHFLALGLDPRRTILTVHDAASLYRLRGIFRFIYTLFWFRLPLRRVAQVTVISEATLRHLSEAFGIPPERFRVIPDCVSSAFVPVPAEFRPSRPRILQIGTKKNKNIDRVAAALEGIDCELRVVGKLSELQKEALERARVNYSEISSLSLEELVREYTDCDMLIFASTIEGFGMPIIEAQATGRPVVTSNCSSMPEVAGDGACFVDPLDVDSIREGILKVCSDRDYREELIKEGLRNARKYVPQVVAEQYAQLYREIADAARR